VQAFLGTPQDLSARLGKGVVFSRWSLASAHLLEDVLSDDLIVRNINTIFMSLSWSALHGAILTSTLCRLSITDLGLATMAIFKTVWVRSRHMKLQQH
jgi:hypothetical protein